MEIDEAVKELETLKGSILIQLARKAELIFEKYSPIQSHRLDGRKRILNLELKKGQKVTIKFRKVRNKNELVVAQYTIRI